MSRVTSKTAQIKKIIMQQARRGEIACGGSLPAERMLVTTFGVSRTTVRAALDELEKEGIIDRKQGSGTYVLKTVPEQPEPTPEAPVLTVGFVLGIARYTNFLFKSMIESFIAAVGPDIRVVCFFHGSIKPETYAGAGCGLLVVDGGFDSQVLDQLTKLGIPLITVNREVADMHYVTPDHYKGGRLMAEYLAKKGHRHVLCLMQHESSGLPANDEMALRKKGLDKAGARHGIEISFQHMSYPYDSSSMAQMLGIWRDHGNPPSAIALTTPMMALRLYDVFQEMNMRIPEDMSILGYDDLYYNAHLTPPLTAVRQPFEEMAQYLVYATRSIVRGTTWKLRKKLAPSLVENDSVTNMTNK